MYILSHSKFCLNFIWLPNNREFFCNYITLEDHILSSSCITLFLASDPKATSCNLQRVILKMSKFFNSANIILVIILIRCVVNKKFSHCF